MCAYIIHEHCHILACIIIYISLTISCQYLFPQQVIVIFQTEGQRLISKTTRENYLNDHANYFQATDHILTPETRWENYPHPDNYSSPKYPRQKAYSDYLLLSTAPDGILSPSPTTHLHLSRWNLKPISDFSFIQKTNTESSV